MSRFCVFGSWHLAQVMSACFAEKGHTVCVVHDDKDAIKSLAAGKPTVFEPDLEASIGRSLAARKLSFSTNYRGSLRGRRVAFLSADTPITRDGTVNLRPIRAEVPKIAKAMSGPLTLVVASQVPIGTCEKLQALGRKHTKHRFDVVCNPEFLRLGGAMVLQRAPDSIILGADDVKTTKPIATIYKPFDRPIVTMSLREAEIVKHAANAYVANQVSFIGEIGQICDDYGADAFAVSKALKLDRRVGRFAYVRPGLGFNGGTVRRDVNLLIKLAADVDREAPLMQAILDVNERTNGTVVERLVKLLKRPRGKRVGLLGLTYKAHTSTLRHSLTLQIAEKMMARGLRLRAYDPIIPPRREGVRSKVHEWEVPEEIAICASIEEAADDVDALVVMTDKEDFRDLNLKRLGSLMRTRILVDAVGFYDADTARRAGFRYITIGKGFQWL
ncbi:MAG: nucleotide sugar dehydrogenase [Planctomycetota bacterium]